MSPFSGGDENDPNAPCSSYISAQGSLKIWLNSYLKDSVEGAPALRLKRRWGDLRLAPIITPTPAGPPVGAKFKPKRSPPEAAKPIYYPRDIRMRPRQDAGKVNIIIKGSVPYFKAEQTTAGEVGEASPTIASLSTNNKTTPSAESWKTYEVPKYIASLCSANTPVYQTPALLSGA